MATREAMAPPWEWPVAFTEYEGYRAFRRCTSARTVGKKAFAIEKKWTKEYY
jgi:hypothetical protein